MNQPLKINKLFDSGRLAELHARASDLRKMDILLAELLPAPLNAHCRILSIRNTVMALAADSPVWAARLRFQSPQLVKQLARHLSAKRYTIHVRVRPPETALPLQPHKPVIRPGRQGIALLRLANRNCSR
jgi:hypothetical protein